MYIEDGNSEIEKEGERQIKNKISILFVHSALYLQYINDISWTIWQTHIYIMCFIFITHTHTVTNREKKEKSRCLK